jgi:RNA polymerase sigma-70 factor (ECF subfamily)
LSEVEAAFEEHRGFLWGLSYRMTGCAADADDVVQETFLRALERPPADTARPWRPWLAQVALNLGRDLLRRRRRRGYDGPWLPSPLPTEDIEAPALRADGPAARYDLVESVSIAFLLALEALSPAQRAVLLLRDVFDYSVRDAAQALDMSEANVKTTHLRARRAIAGYEAGRQPPLSAVCERTGATLQAFLQALSRGDTAAVERLLAPNVRSFSDGGGQFHAAHAPVEGVQRVARLFLGLTEKAGPFRVTARSFNGLPAVVLERLDERPGWAPVSMFQVETDLQGRITRLYSVLASRKLTAL